MEIKYNNDYPFKEGVLPQSLKKLKFVGYPNRHIDENENTYNQILEKNVLPKYLEEFYIGRKKIKL